MSKESCRKMMNIIHSFEEENKEILKTFNEEQLRFVNQLSSSLIACQMEFKAFKESSTGKIKQIENKMDRQQKFYEKQLYYVWEMVSERPK